MRRRGFTLIEVIITTVLLTIILTIVFNSYHNAQLKKQQDGIVQDLVSDLEKQKADTVAGKNGSIFGIKFNPEDNNYVLYQGQTFNPENQNNKNKIINSSFFLEETIENQNNLIYFSKLTGEANQTAIITISHIEEKVNPQLIFIEKSGNISVLK